MAHWNRTTPSAIRVPNSAYRPIAWVVSSLFVLAPLVFADKARAQSAVGLRSHVPFTEWVGQTPAAPAQVKSDEQKRTAVIDSTEGLARLATEAKRAEEARQRQRAEEQAKLVSEAQAREVQRMAEEAARLQAARAEALAKQRSAEERAAAEKRRQQEQARAAEAARTEALAKQKAEAERADAEKQRQMDAARATALAKQQAEAERAAAEKRHQEELIRAVDAARTAAEKAAAEAHRREAERQAEETRKAAAQVAAIEAARRAEAERAAAAEARAQQAEEQRRETEARAAAARESQARADAERVRAEAEKAAVAAKAEAEAEAARQNQRENLTARRSDDGLVEFTTAVLPGTLPAVQQDKRTVTPQAKQQPSQALIERSAETSAWTAATVQSAASAAMPVEPVAPNASATEPPAAVGPGVHRDKASAAPTKGTPGQFAQWLEGQSDDFGTGPTPSSEKLREIFWQAVQMAAERSPEVRQSYANVQAATADVAEAKGQRWPQVDIGSQSPGVNFGPGDSGNGNNLGNPLSVNVTTNLFDWGRTKNAIGSREHLSTAASRAYDAAMEKSAYEVSTTLIELGKQRNIVDASQRFVDRMATLVKMLGEIVEVDRGRGSELTQAKTRLLQAEASRDTAAARVRDAELTLRKLVGDEAVMIPRTREWSVEPGDLQRLLSLVGAHPGLQQVKAEAEAADLNAKAVKASGLPQLNWVVSAGMSKDALGRRQPWQTALNLNWGAFRGGSAKAATDAAGARAEASWQRLEQQRRDLEYGVRTADQDAHTMLERADLYQGLSVETDRVRKAFFEQWYHLGRRTLLDVLTAESEHNGNRVAEITNRFDGYQAVFREHYSAGGLALWLRNEQGQ
nr:TolC family protein [uncultured Ralstonia sp.]